MPDTIRWSITLIGLAIALAAAVGVFLPTGHRWAILLPLLAGIGIGVAGLAFGSPDINEVHSDHKYETLFFQSSVAGFVTVVAGLLAVWFRASLGDRPGRSQDVPEGRLGRG